MDIKKQTDQRKVLAYGMLILLGITFFSSISTIYLAYQNGKLVDEITANEKIIIEPMITNEKGYSFYGKRGDARYLRAIALSALSLRLDVSAQNVEQSHEILISMVSNELRPKLIEALSKEKKSLTIDNGSSAFYIKDLKVSPSNGIVDVVGDLEFYYGIKRIQPIKKHYQLRIEIRNSKLEITDFVELAE